MKCWTPLFLVSLLWASVLATYTNDELHNVLESKGKNGIIHLSDENYQKVLYGERDYHLILFLTSRNPKISCFLCGEFAPYYETVANSYRRTYPKGITEDGKNVYFLVSELDDSKKLFKLLALQSIPKVYHFPPTPKDTKPSTFLSDSHEYEFYQGDHIELLSKWVTAVTGNSIDLYIPVDYSKIATHALITFGLIFALKMYSTRLISIVRSPLLWGLVSIVLILMFLTGHMFNQMKNSPYVRDDGRKVEYFAPSPQMQYIFETQALSSLYGLSGLLFLVLTVRVSKIKDAKAQLLASVVVCACLYLLYGIFLNIFGIKYGGYPYRFFEFLKF
ncbi:hypothetical protein METBIDRAFT_33512 [Metschnikowia bicuspidata var. bicuspidata NRRL YB-4993]|uniref:Uncharacterized protein n=1 Tax=Metschnikowia bicuspidata var. bicuspidata NRRL YB-4993 TaxID=869754 RepID=A0A1A0H5G3_9ASCO|nr:hypothetical protein METBIDRAFT_33512 [Metschnikowia bicuspidata var. bicuspidata NRRL YB-4993]OBA19329.1 hypothetical protein METBIDRAFT_33512 [Metschnikowia bicuspidata var. bicuspidata NRRL YB-4993]